MSVFELFRRHPLSCFFVCSLVLIHIYGFAWTCVIVFTFHILDLTLRDTESEIIVGKPLTKNKQKVRQYSSPPPVIYNTSTPLIFNMSANRDGNGKRPTLQSLLYKKSGSSSSGGAGTPPRQPLAAIVKNNIQMNLSPNIDLERKKPIFQSMRSPIASPSVYTTRNASPLARRMRSGLNIASPLNPRNTSMNSFLGSSSSNELCNESPNETLEVHGSYFLNKSILHSPSSQIERPSTPRRYFSPSNVTFNNTPQSPASPCITKTSTESVVEALKEKSKRKRTIASTSDEACTKKKKTNEHDFDTTLNELLPSTLTGKIGKRRNVDELVSTGVQCYISDDETIVRKKKKQSDDKNTLKVKFGLTQGELNDLSQDDGNADATNNALDDTQETTAMPVDSEKQMTKAAGVSFDESVRGIAYNCSFKSVSFADSPATATPDKKASTSTVMSPSVVDRSASKLSALKSMQSPYKKLFGSGGGAAANISPANVKKMRKHPIYFTAKINIDEVQQHHEEFGESGVSLKAFRLNQEESIKRVNSLFDDTDSITPETTGVGSAAASTLTTATATTTAGGFSFGASAAPVQSSASSLFGSSTAASTSGFSFGSAASSAAAPSSAPLSVSTATTSAPASTSVLTGLKMLSSLDASVKPVAPVIAPVASTAPTAAVAAFSFGTAATSAQTAVSSAAVTASVVPAPAVSSGFSFGASTLQITKEKEAPVNPIAAPSLQLPVPTPVATSAAEPATSALSFSIAIQPSTTTTTPSALPSLAPPPASVPAPAATATAAPAFNFSFKPTPEVAAPVSSTPAFNFAAPPASTAPAAAPAGGGISFLSAVSAAVAAVAPTPAPAAAASEATPVSSVAASVPALPSVFSQFQSTNLFGAAASSASATTTTTQASVFGAPASAPAVLSQPSTLFGAAASTSATVQPSLFGSTPATTAPATLPSMFAAAASSAAAPAPTSTFTFGAAASTVPSFNQPAAPTPAPTAATTSALPIFGAATTAPATNGFSFGATSAPAPSTGGFNFGAATAPAAAASTSANIFNVAAPQSTIFGQPAAPAATTAAPANIFGGGLTSSSTASIFGAPAAPAAVTAPAATNIFGAPAASTASSSQSIFGSAATQPAFGTSAPAAGGFGATAPASNPFGATTTQQPASIFGAAPAKPATGGFNFGAAAAPAATSASTGFSFGASAPPSNGSVFGATTSGSVFGAPAATTNNNMFGAAKPAENIFAPPAKPASGFDFSSSLSTGPAINFGASAAAPAPAMNGFGAPQAQPQNGMPKPTFNFGGSQPATPSFGSTPASPAFGAATPQPAFGAAPTAFGTPTPAAGSGFTIGSGTSNPPQRQTQRARRRLRR